jgi:hypothetical protein
MPIRIRKMQIHNLTVTPDWDEKPTAYNQSYDTISYEPVFLGYDVDAEYVTDDDVHVTLLLNVSGGPRYERHIVGLKTVPETPLTDEDIWEDLGEAIMAEIGDFEDTDDDAAYGLDDYRLGGAVAPAKGHIITELEGYDLGPEGAVVLKTRGDTAELIRLDTKEVFTVDISKLDYNSEEPSAEPAIEGGWYDEDAMEDNPALHDIRTLPTYWGPRDTNMPSTLTDVTWRPENLQRRWQQRRYNFAPSLRDDDNYQGSIMKRRALYPALDPAPSVPQGNKNNQYHRDFRVPNRVNLQKWVEDDATLPVETLLELTAAFWQGYWEKRETYMPEHGNRKNLNMEDWGLMFQQRMDLSRKEMMCLYHFMVETDVIPASEAKQFEDLYDTFYVHRYDRI